MSKSCCGGKSTAILKVKKADCCNTEPIDTDTVTEQKNSCCSGQLQEQSTAENTLECGNHIETDYRTGYIHTLAGEVPQITTELTFKDTLGSWKCRWSIGRMDYKVEPGIYAVGTPDNLSQVLVTANYKMTFDRLREQLGGLNLWIVVLDTDGVNVWCAAGKGTFGTDELVSRITAVRLQIPPRDGHPWL